MVYITLVDYIVVMVKKKFKMVGKVVLKKEAKGEGLNCQQLYISDFFVVVSYQYQVIKYGNTIKICSNTTFVAKY